MEIYSESLAKMFAAENIAIQIKNSSTAYFDLEHRRMTFPKWILSLPVASRELLMLHEASHALHTPKIGTHEAAREYEQVYRSIINILEDKRIEDLMKQKFPGAKATFTRGFFELVNSNLFGIHFDEDMSGMTLLDKMNLHFKGDYYFEPQFTEEEQYWVDRAASNKTFEEVEQNAKDLYEYLKEEYSKEVLENIKSEIGEFSIGDGEGGEFTGESYTLDELEDILPEEKFEELKEALDNHEEEKAKEIVKDALQDDNLDFGSRNASQTEQVWEKNQEKLQERLNEEYSPTIINVAFAKKVNADDFIISNDIVTKTINQDASYIGEIVKAEFEEFIRNHKEEMSPIIAHMVREFYRKKAAEDFRRTRQSKTGNLDMKKLSRYKFDSDLFLNKSIVKDEKNHGFVLLLDWSVSMSHLMTNAILQLINNVMFCKAINVPFVAYSFSSEAHKTSDNQMRLTFHAVEEGDYTIQSDLKLLELVDSTKSNYEQQLRNLFYLAFSFYINQRADRQEYFYFLKRREERINGIGTHYSLKHELEWAENRAKNMFVLSDMFHLGGTPLNDSLMLSNYILPRKQKEMNVSVLNFVVITDGDSNCLERISSISHHEMKPLSSDSIEQLESKEERLKERQFLRECNNTRYHWGPERISSEPDTTYIKSLYTNKVYNLNKKEKYDIFSAHNGGRKITRNLAHVIKQETNANVICIELVTNSAASLRKNFPNWFGLYDHAEQEACSIEYRKNGFCVISNCGYDQIFVVDVNKVGNQKYNNYYNRNFEGFEETDHFDELEVKDETKGLTTRQLKTALNKNQSVKNNRKFMATRLVEIMSEHQALVEKKKKIELSLDISSDVCYNAEDEVTI